MTFVEIERGDLACTCGCGRTWLVSRGTLALDGETVPFVAMPTSDHDRRTCWLAIARGGTWAFTRTWLDGDNISAALVDPDQSPIAAVSLDGARLPRAQVVGDAARKQHAFAVHDALLRAHADLQQLFAPERGRDFSFKFPDCVHTLPASQRSRRNQDNFAECGERMFVRALLPIAISDGGELRIGVWVEVDRAAFLALFAVFWDDEAAYLAMQLDGSIENSLTVSGREVRGARVTLAARTADKCLFVRDSADAWLARTMQTGITVRALPTLIQEIQRSVTRLPN